MTRAGRARVPFLVFLLAFFPRVDCLMRSRWPQFGDISPLSLQPRGPCGHFNCVMSFLSSLGRSRLAECSGSACGPQGSSGPIEFDSVHHLALSTYCRAGRYISARLAVRPPSKGDLGCDCRGRLGPLCPTWSSLLHSEKWWVFKPSDPPGQAPWSPGAHRVVECYRRWETWRSSSPPLPFHR